MSAIDIEKVAELAKLTLTDSEKEKLGKELNNVLNSFNAIKTANLDNLEPMLNPTAETRSEVAEGRQDAVQRFEGAPDALLSNAPDKLGRLFKTPPIV